MHPLMTGEMAAERQKELVAAADYARKAAKLGGGNRLVTAFGLRLVKAGVRLVEGHAAQVALIEEGRCGHAAVRIQRV